MRPPMDSLRSAHLLKGVLFLAVIAGVGCSSHQLSEFIKDLIPPRYDYQSYLVPAPEMENREGYRVGEDGSVTFDRKGLRITVKYLSDKEMNAQFPDVSHLGKFSVNPFTYGNWRDPTLGYTPNRFTVFLVRVHNPVLPRVKLNPRKAILTTDRAEELTWYTPRREVESKNCFEDYYILRRGSTGNDMYRYDQRMGIVRQTAYHPEHPVFKGGDYEGYLAFDPLDPRVKKVRLTIRDFILRFDEFDHPSEMTDVEFGFARKIEIRRIEE